LSKFLSIIFEVCIIFVVGLGFDELYLGKYTDIEVEFIVHER